jgi:tetraacyldisaccharide 4'-kinase
MTVRRPWAWPLAPMYAAVLAAKQALRRVGWPRVRKLRWPVVSVGSVSAGGAGKTPLVIALAKLLQEHGWHGDVLSRGYGRRGRAVERVAIDAPDAAQRFGDEPLLIAQRAGVPVWVGAERFAAGSEAEAAASGEARGVHLLDDGFQHRQLARAFDMVLVTAEDLRDALLPAGNRREPLAALWRADAIVIREDEREEVETPLRAWMRSGTLLWSVHRRLRFPAPLGVLGAGLRPIAFCAIARPEGFAAMLAEAGCGVIETVAFADHRAYTKDDIEQVLRVARGLQATGFVTTEKDAVKLTKELRSQLAVVGPLVVVALEAEFVYPERVARELEARLA